MLHSHPFSKMKMKMNSQPEKKLFVPNQRILMATSFIETKKEFFSVVFLWCMFEKFEMWHWSKCNWLFKTERWKNQNHSALTHSQWVQYLNTFTHVGHDSKTLTRGFWQRKTDKKWNSHIKHVLGLDKIRMHQTILTMSIFIAGYIE